MSFIKNLSLMLLLSCMINLPVINNIEARRRLSEDNYREITCEKYLSSSPFGLNPFEIADKLAQDQACYSNETAVKAVKAQLDYIKQVRPNISNAQILDVLQDCIALHDTASRLLATPDLADKDSKIEQDLVKVLAVIKAELHNGIRAKERAGTVHGIARVKDGVGHIFKGIGNIFTYKYHNSESDSVIKIVEQMTFDSVAHEDAVLNQWTLELFDFEIFLWLRGESSLLKKHNIFKSVELCNQFMKPKVKAYIDDQGATFNSLNYAHHGHLQHDFKAPVRAAAPIINDRFDYRWAEQTFNYINF